MTVNLTTMAGGTTRISEETLAKLRAGMPSQ